VFQRCKSEKTSQASAGLAFVTTEYSNLAITCF